MRATGPRGPPPEARPGPAKPLGTQPKHHDCCLDCDGGRHLRCARGPIPEDDRDLLDSKALLERPPRGLDLKAVSGGAHLLKRDAVERARCEALEASGQVTGAHAEYHPRIDRAPAADRSTPPRPVEHPAPSDVAWIREPSPHPLTPRAAAEGPAGRARSRSPSARRCRFGASAPRRIPPCTPAQSRSSPPVQDPHATIGGGQPIGDLPGPVGGTIVDHEDDGIQLQRVELLEKRAREGRHVLRLVVRRYTDAEGDVLGGIWRPPSFWGPARRGSRSPPEGPAAISEESRRASRHRWRGSEPKPG